MVAKWLSRLRGGALDRPPTVVHCEAAPPIVEAGVIYAIGDLHGRADLLELMLATIRARDPDISASNLRLIFLGDFVDRGAQSREVVERVCGLADEAWCQVVALKGNHEELLLRFVDGAEIGREWTKLGGNATLKSYGISPPSFDSPEAEWSRVRAELSQLLPAAHLAFFRSLRLWETSGDYIFVHAGVKPGVPLGDQRARDLLWIRGEFDRCEQPSDRVVVYGHTPSPQPKIGRWKIGLDTGAYGSGVLTAMRFESTSQELIQASLHKA